MRGLRNPVVVKLGPTTTPNEVIALLNRLYPNKSHGASCVTLITRLGAQNVGSGLPKLIRAVQASAHHQPIWMSDPSHGNTVIVTAERIKTRCVMTMLDELQRTYIIHRRLGSHLGGLHFEQTGENVVECVNHVAAGTADLSLKVNYRTLCDPRLSQEQGKLLLERFMKYVKQFEAEEKVRNEQQQQQKDQIIYYQIEGAAGERKDWPFMQDHLEELMSFAYQPPSLAMLS